MAEFLTIATIHLLAVMSPGPDFILIVKNSIGISRKVGVYSAIGLGLGILVHVTYSLVGIGLIISQSIILFSIIKYCGAFYLIYIGIMSLRAKKQTTLEIIDATKTLSPFAAVKMGFLTNVLNPKATLFFLSLFTLVISPETSTVIQIAYGLEMSLMTFTWFALVALFLSHEKVKQPFIHVRHYFERVMGGLLVALGIKVALTSKE